MGGRVSRGVALRQRHVIWEGVANHRRFTRCTVSNRWVTKHPALQPLSELTDTTTKTGVVTLSMSATRTSTADCRSRETHEKENAHESDERHHVGTGVLHDPALPLGRDN